MSHRRKSHGGGQHNLNDLLVGSVPDEQSPATDRPPRSRTISSNDRILPEPRDQHGSKRFLALDSPNNDGLRYLRDNFTGRSIAATCAPNTALYLARKGDSFGYDQPGSLRIEEQSSYDMSPRRSSMDCLETPPAFPATSTYAIGQVEHSGRSPLTGTSSTVPQSRRRPLNQDEFDGPTQLLPPPLTEDQVRAQTLPDLPVHLNPVEQDEVMRRYGNSLAQCAFHFVARYQFPIPLEKDKPPIRHASDRDWTEWAYLLKRLATKRRIPARVLYDNQIKHLVTVLENSIPIRNARTRESSGFGKTMKDDRYLLQLVSAGIQVARILMDSLAMQELIALYIDTETIILDRR